MHETCPLQEEFISAVKPGQEGLERTWFNNESFRSESTVVGWINIGTTSRAVTREVVGRVADSVVLFPNGEEKIQVRTYVRSYKGDYPLSKLGGQISRSWGNEGFEETELTELYSREYARTLSYSHFASDPEILFPGVEINITPAVLNIDQPQLVPQAA